MHYFYVTYETRDGEHEYEECGVLSAQTLKQAEKKAMKAKALFDRPGWEDFCKFDCLTDIPMVDYLVLEKYMVNIDRYLDGDGELRV